jgi:hypothetical protein
VKAALVQEAELCAACACGSVHWAGTQGTEQHIM